MSFTIKFCSDLHINKYYPKFPTVRQLFDTEDPFIADVCILIGDITNFELIKFYKKFLSYLSSYFSLLILVPGNHEYYNNTSRKKTMEELDQIAKQHFYEIPNLEILSNTYIDIGDIRIFGSILWSYVPNNAPKRDMQIYNYDRHLLSVSEHNMLNYSCIQSLKKCIEQSQRDDKSLIIATHYAPLFDMFDDPRGGKKGEDDLSNYWYCNDLRDIIKYKNMRLWLFGHTHTPYEKEINGTLVLSNPYVYGYRRGIEIHIG